MKYIKLFFIAVLTLLIGCSALPLATYASVKRCQVCADESCYISSGRLLDKNGKELLSSEYTGITYLGGNLFAVYKASSGELSDNGIYEYRNPYIYDVSTGKLTEVTLSVPGTDVHLFPTTEKGYSRVQNESFYEWTTQYYYSFVNGKGELTIPEQPYTFCSDMMRYKKKDYYFTTGVKVGDYDDTTTLTKHDKEGKVLKTVTIPAWATVDVVEYDGERYIRVLTYRSHPGTENDYVDRAELYNLNLREVRKFTTDEIVSMKKYEYLKKTYKDVDLP